MIATTPQQEREAAKRPFWPVLTAIFAWTALVWWASDLRTVFFSSVSALGALLFALYEAGLNKSDASADHIPQTKG